MAGIARKMSYVQYIIYTIYTAYFVSIPGVMKQLYKRYKNSI